MFIILSQKIDSESVYSGDEVFKMYHYPKRYRNQIHTGDTFIYYQGNRYDKSQRYYFGTGKIGKIQIEDSENYYAQLIEVRPFQNKVSIYLKDNGYVEQLGYETVRRSKNPPWQSSIRPLSEEAYNYILKLSGIMESIPEYDAKLKKAVQRYFIGKDKNALLEIRETVERLEDLYKI